MVKLLPLACRKAFMESVLLFPRGVLAVIRPPSDCMPVRHSSSSNQNQSEAQTSVVSKPSGGEVQTVFVKVKETTKTVTYLGVILAGVGLTGLIFKTVIKGLFSKKSPNYIYSLVLERCRNDPRLQYELGSPITGYGEETRRERRRHVRMGMENIFFDICLWNLMISVELLLFSKIIDTDMSIPQKENEFKTSASQKN